MKRDQQMIIRLKEEIAIDNTETSTGNSNLTTDTTNSLDECEAKAAEILKELESLENKINEIENNIKLYTIISYEGTNINIKNSLEGPVGEYTITGHTAFKINSGYTEQMTDGAILESIGEAEKNSNGKYPIIIKSCGKNLINQGVNYSEIKNLYGVSHPYASKDGVKLIVGGDNRFICMKARLKKDNYYTLSCNIKNKTGTSRVLLYYILNGKDNYENNLVINLPTRIAYKFKASIDGEYELKFYYGGTAQKDENCILYNFQLEQGEQCSDYEAYVENKGAVFMDQPLRGINSIADKIKNNKLVRNIGVRNYISGDEKLTNVMTDKITTLYVLDNPAETEIEVLNLTTYNNMTNISMENKIQGTINIQVLSNIMSDNNFNIKNITLALQNQIFSANNALNEIKNEIENISDVSAVGIKYNDPILKGAKGDGINDDSLYFNEKYNYLEEGKSFLINKEKAKSLKTSIGSGFVIIKDFPYNPQPNQPQGKFSMEYINDEVIMDMNLPNESVPNGATPKQQIGGSFPFDDIAMPKDYDTLNPWGQIYLIKGASYPDNAILHIKNMALIVFKKSTQNWEIINDVNSIDGGYYYEDYRDQSLVKADITRYKDEICVKIDSTTKGRCFHFWTKKVVIDNPQDILYVTSYVDAWVSGDNLEGKFVFDVGADYNQSATGTVHEVIAGRFKDLKTYPRRAYATNLNYNLYIKLCNQQLIDNLKTNKKIYDVATGNVMINDIQYNPSTRKLMILKDTNKFYSKTIDDYTEINPFSKIYIPSRRDYGNEDYYLNIGTFSLSEVESDACTINLEIFSDVKMTIYSKMWILITKDEGENVIPSVKFIQTNSNQDLSFSKKIFALINKNLDQNNYKVDLYLTKFPIWTPCHMYVDITAPRLDSFKFNEYILKPYSNYIDSPDLYWKNEELQGTKVEFTE